MIHVAYIEPVKASDAWAVLEPMLAKALTHAHGELATKDVLVMIQEHKAQMWLVLREPNVWLGCALTEIVTYPRLKSVRIIALAGKEFTSWMMLMHQTLVRFGQSEGAVRIEAFGRKGWVRMLRELGYEEAYVTVMADIGRSDSAGSIDSLEVQ